MGQSDTPRNLTAKVPVVDFALHFSEPIAALGLVNGKIKFYNYERDSNRMQTVAKPLDISVACRSVCFVPTSGERFAAGFENGAITIGDTYTGKTERTINGTYKDTPDAIYVMKPVNKYLLFTGHDSGTLKVCEQLLTQNSHCNKCYCFVSAQLFDIRLPKETPAVQFSNQFQDENGNYVTSTDDWVSDIYILGETGHKVLASRSDGSICTYSTRRGGKEVLRSESLGAELTGITGPMKNGKKLIVAATDGAINIFNWNEFGNISDRFPINKSGKLKSASGKYSIPISIDSICQLNDSLIFVGCGDGKIRLASILPNAVLATVGTHEVGYPIEHLHLTPDKSLLTSSCYDGTVRFWSVAPYKNVELSTANSDEGGDSSDETESDIGGPRRQPRLKKRKKEIKKKLSQKKSFFADLDADNLDECDATSDGVSDSSPSATSDEDISD